MILQLAILVYIIIGAITAHDILNCNPQAKEYPMVGFVAEMLLFVAVWPAVWMLRIIVLAMRRLR